MQTPQYNRQRHDVGAGHDRRGVPDPPEDCDKPRVKHGMPILKDPHLCLIPALTRIDRADARVEREPPQPKN